MNKTRRAILASLREDLDKIQTAVEALLEEEEEYRDNIPENLQGSERYERADNACEQLQEAVEQIGFAIDSIESAEE